MFLKRFLVISLALFFCFLYLSPVKAVGAGFVPSSQLWFSEPSSSSTIKIFTVVLNNEFSSLDATVGFYANGQLVQSVDLKDLKKEEARQVGIEWQPEQGKYNISVAFIKAQAKDEKGDNIDINTNSLGSVPAFGLDIPSSTASQEALAGSSVVQAPLVPEESVLVEKNEEGISVKKALSNSDIVKNKFSETVDAVSKKAEESVDETKKYLIAKSGDAVLGAVSGVGDFFISKLPSGWTEKFGKISAPFLRFWKEQTNGDPDREKMVAAYIFGMFIFVAVFIWYWVFRKRRKDNFED